MKFQQSLQITKNSVPFLRVWKTSCASGWGSTWGFHCSLVGYLRLSNNETRLIFIASNCALQRIAKSLAHQGWFRRSSKGYTGLAMVKIFHKTHRDFLMPQWGKQFELERLQQKAIRFRHRIEGPHNEDDVLPLFGVFHRKMPSKCSWLSALLSQLHGSAPDGVWKVQRKVSYGHVEIKLMKLYCSKLAQRSTRLMQ